MEYLVESVSDAVKEVIRSGRYFPTSLDSFEVPKGVPNYLSSIQPSYIKGRRVYTGTYDFDAANPPISDPVTGTRPITLGDYTPKPKDNAGLIRINPLADRISPSTRSHEGGHAYSMGALVKDNPNAGGLELERIYDTTLQPKVEYELKKPEGFARAVQAGEVASRARTTFANKLLKTARERPWEFSLDSAINQAKTRTRELMDYAMEKETNSAANALDAVLKSGDKERIKGTEQQVKKGIVNTNKSKAVQGIEAGWNYSGISDEDLAKQIARRARKEGVPKYGLSIDVDPSDYPPPMAMAKEQVPTFKPQSRILKGLGALGAVLGIAGGASADEIAHGLHPLSVLDSGSLGTDDMMGEPIEFSPPKSKEQKPLPGAEFIFPKNKNN